MAVETATYVSQLDPTKPGINDLKSEGDDHLRLIKTTLTTTFPNIQGVSSSPTSNSVNILPTTQGMQAAIASASFSSSLPAQTGNAGKFITTDGTTASWAEVPPSTPFSNTTALAQIHAVALSF